VKGCTGAGVNGHMVGDERAPQKRRSDCILTLAGARSGERLRFEKLAEILEETEQVIGVTW
jgi:hypothetical protein